MYLKVYNIMSWDITFIIEVSYIIYVRSDPLLGNQMSKKDFISISWSMYTIILKLGNNEKIMHKSIVLLQT